VVGPDGGGALAAVGGDAVAVEGGIGVGGGLILRLLEGYVVVVAQD
jgi:hypothetical protein